MKKTISYLLMGVGMVSLLTLANCSKKDNPLPAIDGFNSSDEVAADHLAAYFPFDGNANDTKGGSTATASGVTFVTGMRGQAYQGSASGYATLTPSAAFSGLGSYTLSMWIKVPAQIVGGHPGGLFFLSGTNTQNELIYELDNPTRPTSDSIAIHHGFTNLGSPGYQGFTMSAYDTTDFHSWKHIVTTYDGTSSVYIIYSDGVALANGSAYGTKTSTTLYQGPGDVDPLVPQGPISWATDAPKEIIIGTWPAGLYGVSPTLGSNGCFLGNIDELRIYNSALSASDVGALYQLGLAGR